MFQLIVTYVPYEEGDENVSLTPTPLQGRGTQP
jgi:hypothetical protein